MRKRRYASLALCGILLAGSLWGCAGKTEPAPAATAQEKQESKADESLPSEGTSENTAGGTAADSEPVVLRMAWWGNQKRNDITVEALNLYTQMHPNVTFETEPSDWSGYFDKLATQVATGNLPDIIQQDYNRLTPFYQKGQLMNLQPYVDSGVINPEGIAQSVLDSGSYDGELYALCNGLTSRCLVYDKEVVEEAGVTIPDQMTWDEFFEISKTIHEKTGVQTYFLEKDICDNLYRSAGMPLYASDGKSLSGEDDALLVRLFTMGKQAMDEGWHVSPETLVEKNPEVVETMPIMDKTTWNSFTNSNQYSVLCSTAGRELGITMYPKSADAVKNPVYLKPSQFFCGSATTEHPEVVADVINFLVTSVEANQILKGERGTPVSASVLEVLKADLSDTERTSYDFIDQVVKIATPADPPSPSGASEVTQVMSDYMEQVRYGLITPEDAAAAVFKEANDILSSTN